MNNRNILDTILYPQGFSYTFDKRLVTQISNEPGIDQIVEISKPLNILELGSWHGKSAINFGKKCLDQNLDVNILCVDTWLGSHEYWTTYVERQPLVSRSFDVFCSNIVANKLVKNVLPFRQTTENAIQILKYHDIKFDLIYWDCGHESVLKDLLLCEDVIDTNGIIVIDDYFQHQIVKQQVESYLTQKLKNKEVIHDKIIIRNN